MSNKHILHFASRACLIAGMVTLIVAVIQVPYEQQLAQLTQQGAILVPQNVQLDSVHLGGTIKPAPSIHAAAPVGNLSAQMIVGALLLFAGLSFHVLWVIRHGDNRTVQIHSASTSKKNKKRPVQHRVRKRSGAGRAYWLYVHLR